MKPYVSVIIPTFERRHRLAAAVDSALRQTVENTEVIVVDDGSSDGCLDLVRQVDDERVRIVVLPEHSGRPAVARNRGLRAAVAPWVAFLDSDDTWLPHHLWTCLSWLEANDEGFASTTLAGRASRDAGDTAPESVSARSVSTDDLLLSNPIATSTVVCRRDLVQAVGGFPECAGIYEDLALWFRISMRTSMHVLDRRTTQYAVSSDSLSGQIETKRYRYGTYFDFFRWLRSDGTRS